MTMDAFNSSSFIVKKWIIPSTDLKLNKVQYNSLTGWQAIFLTLWTKISQNICRLTKI